MNITDLRVWFTSLINKSYIYKQIISAKKNIANLRYNEFVQLFGAPVYIYIYIFGGKLIMFRNSSIEHAVLTSC